jgi:hypothetical protein
MNWDLTVQLILSLVVLAGAGFGYLYFQGRKLDREDLPPRR